MAAKEAMQIVKEYLDKRANEDEQFAAKYKNSKKSINKCWAYILGEAKKRGDSVVMTDEEVFGLAIHYYDEGEVTINQDIARTVRASVVLTDEEKEQLKEQMKAEYKQKLFEEQRKEDELKAKEALKAQRKAAKERKQEAEESQLSLF